MQRLLAVQSIMWYVNAMNLYVHVCVWICVYVHVFVTMHVHADVKTSGRCRHPSLLLSSIFIWDKVFHYSTSSQDHHILLFHICRGTFSHVHLLTWSCEFELIFSCLCINHSYLLSHWPRHRMCFSIYVLLSCVNMGFSTSWRMSFHIWWLTLNLTASFSLSFYLQIYGYCYQ